MESLYTSCDYLPWTNSNTVHLWDRKFANCSFDKQNFEVRYPLMQALVTSRRPEDIQRGIELIQGSLPFTTDPRKKKKETYLLAVGYFRSGDYPKSATLVDTCLEIKPNCWKALTLKEVLTDRINRKDRVITLIDVAATTFGVLADVLGGVAAASRSSAARRGIVEDVPERRPSITPKKSTNDGIDVIGICALATGLAVGVAISLVLCPSK
ncbi:mitochondrial fission 1 protein A [Artemisia annua]|uniref:Mitochondrial fission 1 protein A n=1 Tax=Artemisia annua TaxID=35608 RepID=A0A2U1M340_ARTAN|nr:mitochondrial fission 1 protein A [Artemisia annua]